MGLFERLSGKRRRQGTDVPKRPQQPQKKEERDAATEEPKIRTPAAGYDITRLIDAAEHEDRKVASEALEALRGVTDPGAATQLIEALESDNRPVRLAAADALCNIGDKRAFEPLLKAARAEAIAPQRYTNALASMEFVDDIERLIPLLKEDKHTINDWAEKTLGRIGEKSIGLLLEALSREDWGQQESYRAALALKEIGLPAVPALIEALEHESARVRGVVVTALGKIAAAEAVEPLIGALQYQSADVRAKAIRALGEIGGERVRRPILDRLEDDDAAVRVSAARTLLNLTKDEFTDVIVDAMTKALEEEDWQVRDEAAHILGRTHSRKAVPRLVRAVKEDSENVVREAAYMALREIVPENELGNLITRGSD